ncbi:MAG: hypothetical protein KAF91_21805 [Nostoc sp. TH1S01]|nr:hypothetical protein [Nostoc sp. TH1S01]
MRLFGLLKTKAIALNLNIGHNSSVDKIDKGVGHGQEKSHPLVTYRVHTSRKFVV